MWSFNLVAGSFCCGTDSFQKPKHGVLKDSGTLGTLGIKVLEVSGK